MIFVMRWPKNSRLVTTFVVILLLVVISGVGWWYTHLPSKRLRNYDQYSSATENLNYVTTHFGKLPENIVKDSVTFSPSGKQVAYVTFFNDPVTSGVLLDQVTQVDSSGTATTVGNRYDHITDLGFDSEGSLAFKAVDFGRAPDGTQTVVGETIVIDGKEGAWKSHGSVEVPLEFITQDRLEKRLEEDVAACPNIKLFEVRDIIIGHNEYVALDDHQTPVESTIDSRLSPTSDCTNVAYMRGTANTTKQIMVMDSNGRITRGATYLRYEGIHPPLFVGDEQQFIIYGGIVSPHYGEEEIVWIVEHL